MTKNPVKKYLINRFMKNILDLITMISPQVVLDAGCGEGYIINDICRELNCDIFGIDINAEAVKFAQTLFQDVHRVKLMIGNINDLPFDDCSFDLVICNEVLEHLEKPLDGLNELRRVSKGKVIISVPHEPYFRLSNLLALKHIKKIGNAPGHINHFTKNRLSNLITDYFCDYEFYYSFPWIIVYGTFGGK
ncbi:MAG: class I SAM-dependent methyltransferase [Elusimicrobiota bacterium]